LHDAREKRFGPDIVGEQDDAAPPVLEADQHIVGVIVMAALKKLRALGTGKFADTLVAFRVSKWFCPTLLDESALG
jgi:hypothetical protein